MEERSAGLWSLGSTLLGSKAMVHTNSDEDVNAFAQTNGYNAVQTVLM